MATEKIMIQIGDEVIELKGAEKEAFLEERAKMKAEEEARLQAQNALKELRISAYTKLGLTDDEIQAII